jgi:hypothetical protein
MATNMSRENHSNRHVYVSISRQYADFVYFSWNVVFVSAYGSDLQTIEQSQHKTEEGLPHRK